PRRYAGGHVLHGLLRGRLQRAPAGLPHRAGRRAPRRRGRAGAVRRDRPGAAAVAAARPRRRVLANVPRRAGGAGGAARARPRRPPLPRPPGLPGGHTAQREDLPRDAGGVGGGAIGRALTAPGVLRRAPLSFMGEQTRAEEWNAVDDHAKLDPALAQAIVGYLEFSDGRPDPRW